MRKCLIYGYGNPGREDDGLGAAFVNKMEQWLMDHPIPGIGIDCNYQLNIEDAEKISAYDEVLFVDASQEDIENYYVSKVNPSNSRIEFSMHAVSVGFVLDLCRKMFNKTPDTYLLHIKGYGWDFKEKLTEQAVGNLELAFNFVSAVLKENKGFTGLVAE